MAIKDESPQDKNIKIVKRIFMTATERRYAGSKDEVISMDHMNMYGDTFEFLSFKEALDEAPPHLGGLRGLGPPRRPPKPRPGSKSLYGLC